MRPAFVLIGLLGGLAYLAPAFIAAARGLPVRLGTNLLLGWFLPVWLVLLVAALRRVRTPLVAAYHPSQTPTPTPYMSTTPPWNVMPFLTEPLPPRYPGSLS